MRVGERVASYDLLLAASLREADVDAEPLGGLVMRLPGPGASPPPGAIGIWADGDDFAAVVLTMAGERRFLTRIDGVLSTNASGLLEAAEPRLLD